MHTRVLIIAGVLLALLVGLAAPAAASHDDFEAGTVLLSDPPGREGRVTVVHPLDADEDEAIAQLETTAAQEGVALSDVRAVNNQDPDTLRVSAQVPMSERTGFLQRRIPGERIAAWEGLADSGQIYLTTSRWVQVEGLRSERDDAYAVADAGDVVYRISGWALVVPLVVLLGAGLIPYVALRLYAESSTRRGGPPEDQLHRIRRATVAIQLLVPFLLIAVLFTTDTIDWGQLLLAELLPAVSPPRPVSIIVGFVGFVLPFIAAVIASVLATLPYDRQLRSTEQSARAGAGQALRVLLLMLVPLIAWITLVSVLPDIGGWSSVPILLLFVFGIAAVQPLIMNTVLRTRPLAEPLRRRVLALCREHGVPVRDARLLDSRGGRVANAAISGILPQLRYVYLTDHVIDVLDEDELEAVLAHEIGHGKGHHLLLKLIAGIVALGGAGAALAVGGAPVVEWLGDTFGPLGLFLAMPLVLVVVFLLVHGGLGVALEKRADDHAARIVGAEPTATALDKLADANKTKRRTGWMWNLLQQHPGTEQRIARLAARTDSTQPVPR